MLLTEAQLHEIKKIVEDHHLAFIVNTIGPDAVAPEILERLKERGLISVEMESIKDAYLYGQVLAALQDPKIAAMGYDEFKNYLTKNPVPLSGIEQQAVKMAQVHAAQYVKGLGNRVDIATGSTLINADAGLRAKMRDEIQTATEANIARRETVKQLKSDLGWQTNDWARDWDRIAVTEKQDAMQQGVADHYAKRYGSGVTVAKIPRPDACDHCIRLHLGPDGQPRIFKLSALQKNGSNFNRKAGEWKATIGPVHPHCQCQLVRVPAGWGFNEHGELTPGGTLGIHYEDDSDLAMALLQEDDLQKAFKFSDHVEFQGLPIVIENQAGSVRKWKDSEGGTGSTTMPFAYGYIERTNGADMDEIDVFVGPDPRAAMAYIIQQKSPATGLYDEDKVMLGFSNANDAKLAYLMSYNRPDFFESLMPMTMEAFKRWIEATEISSGHMAKAEEGLRLVVPLAKAAVTAAEVADHMRVAGRNPSPGTSMNYLFNAPQRDVPITMVDQAHGTRQIAEVTVPREALKRDKRIYEIQEPFHKEPYELQRVEGMTADERAATAADMRAFLQNEFVEMIGVPNSVADDGREYVPQREIDAEGMKRRMDRLYARRPDLKKKKPKLSIEKALKGEAAASHKYIKREWLQDHWIYTYAQTHSGKIEGHNEDLHRAVIKLPKEKMAQLQKLKEKYGLEGQPFEGGKYAMLSITKTEADKLRGATAAAQPLTKVPTPPVEAGNVKRLGPVEIADKAKLDLPKKPDWVLQRGHEVKATVGGNAVVTTLEGQDFLGRPVVNVKGKRHVLQWKDVQKEAGAPTSPLEKLPPDSLVKATERQRQLVDKLMDTKVAGDKTLREYMTWLRSKGEECYLVGGTVRDLISGTVPGSPLTDEMVTEAMKDADIVSTAAPKLALVMGKALGVNPSANWSPWGVVQFLEGGIGLDYASLSSGGSHDVAKIDDPSYPGHKIPPATWDHDLEMDAERRDFLANCLYYDPFNHVVIDPSGHGIADAQNKVLRLAPSPDEQKKNTTIPFRWWKFRVRGFKSEKESLERVRSQAAKNLPKMTEHHIIKEMRKACVKKGGDPKKNLARFREVMAEDGCEHLFDKYIQPHAEAIIK